MHITISYNAIICLKDWMQICNHIYTIVVMFDILLVLGHFVSSSSFCVFLFCKEGHDMCCTETQVARLIKNRMQF
jgi:hypothetical protein